MAMFDFHNEVFLKPAIFPVSLVDNTVQVGPIIDTDGFYEVEFNRFSGGIVDGDATFTVSLDEGDDPALSDAAPVPSEFILGTVPVFSAASGLQNLKFGYNGHKRFVRITVTPANNSSAANFGFGCLLSAPRSSATDVNS